MRDRKSEPKSIESHSIPKSRPTQFSNLLKSDPTVLRPASEGGSSGSQSPTASPGYYSASDQPSAAASPYTMSPWDAAASPFIKSPWTHSSAAVAPLPSDDSPGLVASLVREEGHVYSLATAGGLLYTGSDGKNIRVWKNGSEFSGFKSGSGLVKAIVISGEKIFTGHQDGKIRVWRTNPKNPAVHKRVGSLPRLKDFLRSSINPNNYVEVRRRRNTVWIRHFDAVSCLSLDSDQGLLYSGSWDKTLKVWRVSDSKCLESVNAHDDAINAVAVGFDGLVFTGSADGTVKVWRREGNRHVAVKTLLWQESAVTAIAVAAEAGVVYCGSSDGLVNVWERGRRLVHGGVLRGHRLAVLCLAVAGSLLISGSADRTICVWRRDGRDHRKISVLRGHEGPVKCLAVEEDREYGGLARQQQWVLYSGSLDKSVKVWRVSERASESDGAIVEKTPQHLWGSRSPWVHELEGRPGRVRDWN